MLLSFTLYKVKHLPEKTQEEKFLFSVDGRKAMFYITAVMNDCATAMMNVRMPIPMKITAQEVAHRNGISLSDVVRMALIAGLQEIDSGAFRLRTTGAGQVEKAGGGR
jgi:uncharacterized protein YdbL (DUF1318 family)